MSRLSGHLFLLPSFFLSFFLSPFFSPFFIFLYFAFFSILLFSLFLLFCFSLFFLYSSFFIFLIFFIFLFSPFLIFSFSCLLFLLYLIKPAFLFPSVRLIEKKRLLCNKRFHNKYYKIAVKPDKGLHKLSLHKIKYLTIYNIKIQDIVLIC